MELKDYYKILHLPPSATLPEIKKSYRHLAQQFHPDKNTTDPYAAIYFAEIKEAYEVLTNPSKKNNYLQQRWYRQSLGKTNFSDQHITAPTILKQLLELDKQVSTLDIYRMDQYGLHQHLQDILSDDIIDQLKNFNEPDIIHEITRITLRIAKFLQKKQVEDLTNRLIRLAGTEEPITEDPITHDSITQDPNAQHPNVQHHIKQEINSFLNGYNRKNRWEKYKPAIIILITAVISLLIYFVSR